MEYIEKLNKEELKSLLKDLKLYSSLRKNLGKRGKIEYDKIINSKSSYIVEYFGKMDLDDVKSLSKNVYLNTFKENVNESDVTYIINDSLQGGIRVLRNDEMVDLSYKKITDILKNNL